MVSLKVKLNRENNNGKNVPSELPNVGKPKTIFKCNIFTLNIQKIVAGFECCRKPRVHF